MSLILILLQAAPRQQTGAANYSGILMLLIIGLIIYYFVKVRSKSKSTTPLVTEIAINSDLKWHQKPIATILFLIFFFPIGIYLMWKNNIWSQTARVIISVFFGLLIIANATRNKTTEKTTKTEYNVSNTCKELDHSGNYRYVVNDRLKSTGKIPQLIEFNGNGQYVYQAYDTAREIEFSGIITVNECGDIIGATANVSHF